MQYELHFFCEGLLVESKLSAEGCWVELEGGSYRSDSFALWVLVLALKIWILHLHYLIHSWKRPGQYVAHCYSVDLRNTRSLQFHWSSLWRMDCLDNDEKKCRLILGAQTPRLLAWVPSCWGDRIGCWTALLSMQELEQENMVLLAQKRFGLHKCGGNPHQ